MICMLYIMNKDTLAKMNLKTCSVIALEAAVYIICIT